MRQKRTPQLSLFMTVNNTQIGKELEQMSRILDDTPSLLQVVLMIWSRPNGPIPVVRG